MKFSFLAKSQSALLVLLAAYAFGVQAAPAPAVTKSPVGNAYDYFGKVDRETAAFLQQVADQTVRRFYGWK